MGKTWNYDNGLKVFCFRQWCKAERQDQQETLDFMTSKLKQVTENQKSKILNITEEVEIQVYYLSPLLMYLLWIPFFICSFTVYLFFKPQSCCYLGYESNVRRDSPTWAPCW